MKSAAKASGGVPGYRPAPPWVWLATFALLCALAVVGVVLVRVFGFPALP